MGELLGRLLVILRVGLMGELLGRLLVITNPEETP